MIEDQPATWFENESAGHNILHCPECGANNLHQESYTLFEPLKDDCEDGVTVNVVAGQVTMWHGTKANPNARDRSCLDILFYCECCDAKPRLRIRQHKGFTLLEFTSLDAIEKESDQSLIAGEIAYQLTKQLVIDMPTARATVDAAFAAAFEQEPTDD